MENYTVKLLSIYNFVKFGFLHIWIFQTDWHALELEYFDKKDKDKATEEKKTLQVIWWSSYMAVIILPSKCGPARFWPQEMEAQIKVRHGRDGSRLSALQFPGDTLGRESWRNSVVSHAALLRRTDPASWVFSGFLSGLLELTLSKALGIYCNYLKCLQDPETLAGRILRWPPSCWECAISF